MANGTINKGTIVKSGGSGSGGGGSQATINFFEGTTGSTLDTQLTLGNSVLVFKNGVLLQPTEDYTISGSTITFVTALEATDKIAVINGNLSAIDLTPYQQKSQVVDIDTASVTLSVEANKNYVLSNANITDITISSAVTSYLETTIEFTTGSNAPTLTDSASIEWVDGSAPILSANARYIILIWNKKGFVREY